MDKKQVINFLRRNKEILKANFSILKIGLFGSYSTVRRYYVLSGKR